MKNIINYRYFKRYKKYADYLLKGLYAGLMIGVGAIAFLRVQNAVVGSLLFSVGLLTVCMYGMNLYTGKIGYILNNGKEYLWELGLGLFGNLMGAFICGKLALLTRFGPSLQERAITVVASKLQDNLLSLFILGIFCGILIYIAVNNYKKVSSEIGKYIGIFLCVVVFICCGFEHCIADMAYFSIASMWNPIRLLMIILGNSVGSIIIAWFYNLYYK